MKSSRIVITAGGSGGHVTVSLAVIDQLIKKGIKKSDLLFIGGDLNKGFDTKTGSVEEKVMNEHKIPFVKIRAGKLQRFFSFQGIILLCRTLLGFIDSIVILLKFKPKLVMSFGGYVSLPVCICAKIMGKKVILHEQTASVGLANKIISYFSDKIFVNFESSLKFFNVKKSEQVGNPLRMSIFNAKIPDKIINQRQIKKLISIVEDAKKSKEKIIYITGGGQGSKLFNDFVLDNLESILKKYHIILQSGSQDFDVLKKRFDDKLSKIGKKYQNKIFVSEWFGKEIGYVLDNSDIVVSRGGAGTITELGAICKKSILIPIKWVTNNEQFKNSKILVDLGLGIILDEDNLNFEIFDNAVNSLMEKDPPSRSLINRLFPKDAAEKIANYLLTELEK